MARPMKAPRPWGAETPSFFAIALPPRHSGLSTRPSAYPSTHAVANWPRPSFMIGAGLCAIVRRAAHEPRGVTAMGIVEKTQAKAPVADFGRFRLRRFIEGLGDELETLRASRDALRQKRSRSRRRGALFHQIRIARSRAMEKPNDDSAHLACVYCHRRRCERGLRP